VTKDSSDELPHRPNQLQVISPDGDEIGFDDDDHTFDDYLDDGEFVDIKEAFGLPDSLPPLRLPPAAELATAARESRQLARAKQLGRWVGDRPRPLTDDAELTAADRAAAGQALGIAADGLDLPLLWELAVELGFVEDDGESATTGSGIEDWPDGADEDTLAIWQDALGVTAALALPLTAELNDRADLDFAGVGAAVLAVLFLARADGFPVPDLAEIIRDPATADLPPGEAGEAWRSWLEKHGDPAEALLASLAELGAVEVAAGVARLTPLGCHAMRLQLIDSGVEVPLLPPVEEMTAAQLVALGKTIDQPELAAEAAQWLALRSATVAVEELLAVARAGGPIERMFATSIATDAGPDARAQWRQALAEPTLRPYAKMALSQFEGGTGDEPEPDLEPTLSDVAWVVTDTVVGFAESVDPDGLDPEERAEHVAMLAEQVAQAVPPERAEPLFEQIRRLDHPGAHTALTVIGKHHPDKRTAKAARTAAFKLRPPTKR
jgi:hypothetical protein